MIRIKIGEGFVNDIVVASAEDFNIADWDRLPAKKPTEEEQRLNDIFLNDEMLQYINRCILHIKNASMPIALATNHARITNVLIKEAMGPDFDYSDETYFALKFWQEKLVKHIQANYPHLL